MLFAGAGVRDITPHEPMYLGGYLPTRQSTTVHDPLSARALALAEGDRTVVLIAVDSIGFMCGLADRVRNTVQALTAVPIDHVFVAATHSHSTPDTMGIYGDAPEHYKAHLVVQSAAAAQAAVNSLAPARARWTQVDVPGVSMNRRIPPGALDSQCTVLHVATSAGATIATLTNLALHGVCLGPDNQEVSADFVHFLRTRVEADLGGVALHFNGTEGNVNPSPQLSADDRLDRTGGTFQMAEETGLAIADTVLRALTDVAWQEDSPLESVTGTTTLPVDNEGVIAMIETGALTRELTEGATSAPLGMVRLGDLRLIMLPCEAFSELGLEIKGWWPDTPVGIIGMCNDHVGYVIPPDQFDPTDYEESVSVSPRAWPALERDLRAVAGLSAPRAH